MLLALSWSPAQGAVPQAAETDTAAVGTDPALEPGAPIRVRNTSTSRWVSGQFVGVNAAAIRYRVSDGQIDSILRRRAGRLEHRVAPPNSRRGFFRGAAFGAGVSLLGGALLQLVPTQTPNLALAGGIAMAVPLGLAGGLVGALTNSGEWEPVRIVPAPGLDPGPDGEAELRAFGALVVGEWVSEDSRHVFAWTEDSTAIRSSSFFPADTGWTQVSQGRWWWDPDAGTVRGEVDTENMPFDRMEYRSEVEDGRVVHQLRTHGEGVEEFVEVWTFDADAYRWALYRPGQTGDPIMDGRYYRAQPE